MTVNEARRHLQDNTPARAQTDSVQLNKKTSLVRVWTDMPLDTLPDLESFLRTYTDPKNTSASSTVTDPYADREKHAGTWRLGRVWSETVREETRLYQELHLGFIQSIVLDVADASTWSEAQVVDEVKTDATDEGLLRLRWINVDPAKVHTIIDVLSEVKSYSTVYADGESKGGTWYLHEVVGGKDAGNGGGEIVMKLGLAEETRTFTLGDGTLRPQTVVRYFGVPKSRVETIKAGIAAASTRQNIDIRVDEAYANGECVLTVTTTTMTLVEWNTTIGEAWDITRTQYWKWHVIQSEIEALEATLTISTLEQGKQKSIVKTSNGDGTWDIIATIQDVTHGTNIDYDLHESDLTVYIDGLTTQRQLKYFHLTDAQKANLLTDLSLTSAQAEGVSMRYEDYLVPQFGTWHITVYITTEDSETASVVVTDIASVNGTLERKTYPGAEAEVREYGWYNIPDSILAASVTALGTAPAGWLIHSLRQDRNPQKKLNDLHWRIHKIGVSTGATDITLVQTKESGAAAEQRTIRLFSRDPSNPPTNPTVGGYTLVNYEAIQTEQTIADYVYYFVKTGTANYDFQTDYDAQDAELIRRIYPRRASDPSASAPAGYFEVREEIRNIDGVLKDYIYTFQKTGLTDHVVRTIGPNAAGRQITVVYRDQTVDPSDTDGLGAQAAHFVDYTSSSYTLVAKENSGTGRGIEDWTFVYNYSGAYTTETLTGTTTPGFLSRSVEVNLNVPDQNLSTRMTALETEGINTSTQMVVDIKSDYDGRGTSNIRRVIITLPTTHVKTEYVVLKRYGDTRVKTYSGITRNLLYATDHDTSTGQPTAWSKVDYPALVPATLHVSGKTVQVWYVETTTSYATSTSGAQGVTQPSADTYNEYTVQREWQDPTYGFWIKESAVWTLVDDWTDETSTPP